MMTTKINKQLERECLEELSNKTKDFDALSRLIYMYLNSKDESYYDKALNLIEEKKEEFKDRVEYYNILSLIYRQIGETGRTKDLAIESAKKCIELERRNPRWYFGLSYTYWWYKDLDKAIEVSEEGLKLSQELQKEISVNMNLIKGNLAYFYAEKSDFEKKDIALKYAEDAYNYDKAPSRTDTFGYVLMKFGTSKEDFEKAEKLFLEALKQESDNEFIREHLEEVRRKIKGKI